MARSAKDEARHREIIDRISAQADRVASLLGVDPERIMYQGTDGVVLTPDQLDSLLAIIDG